MKSVFGRSPNLVTNQAHALENQQLWSQIKLPLWKITRSGPKPNSFSGFFLVHFFTASPPTKYLCEIAFFGFWAPRFHFGIIFESRNEIQKQAPAQEITKSGPKSSICFGKSGNLVPNQALALEN